jgi:CHAD domain-containing protein
VTQEPCEDFVLPSGGRARLAEALARGGWRFSEDAPQAVSIRLLDSFDWGAYRAGAAIEERIEGGERRLLWHDLANEGPVLDQPLAEPPGLATDLPPGPVQERVQAAVGIRRLLPVVDFEAETRPLRVLDDEEKTVVRLAVEVYRPSGTAAHGALTPRLRLIPLKGYLAEAQAVAAWLAEDLALETAPRSLVVEALDAGDRSPGGYSSKLAYRLDPAQRAGFAARDILLGLLDTLEANVQGARQNLDSEFLHDLRVATRRTRAALAQIPGVLPAEVTADFKARFAWLQQVTGPVRDLDVYLFDFEHYRDSLPRAMRGDLEALRTYILAHYADEQARLSEGLGSPAFLDLVRDWRHALTGPASPGPAPANAHRPVRDLADERIWRMVRRVRKEGRAITPDSPSADMHELRKSCKKLRYLMEFFQSLYPNQGVGAAIRQLKALLDNLGSFQDLAVQAAHLRDIAAQLQADGLAGTPALLAMGALVADLLRRQEAARESFAETFKGLDSTDGKALFRELFHVDLPAEPAAPDVPPDAGAAC